MHLAVDLTTAPQTISSPSWRVVFDIWLSMTNLQVDTMAIIKGKVGLENGYYRQLT
jgi:hypothetical protein